MKSYSKSEVLNILHNMKQQNQLSMWEKEKKVIQSNITTPLPLNTISPFFFFITSHSHLSPFLSGNPNGKKRT